MKVGVGFGSAGLGLAYYLMKVGTAFGSEDKVSLLWTGIVPGSNSGTSRRSSISDGLN